MSEHFNQLTPAQAERLAILSEECGETIQVIGKILRHGYNSKHPDGGPTNRELLENELGDIAFAVTMLVNGEDVKRTAIGNAFFEKSKKIGKYLHHAKVGSE